MGLRIVDRSQAPNWSKADYPYIQRGFIAPYYKRWTSALETFYRFNNETTNVLTQTAGLLVFLFAFVQVLVELSSSPTGKPRSANDDYYLKCLLMCLVGDIIVCSFSLTCHLWQARNKVWHTVLSVMDWSGTGITAIMTCGVMDWNVEIELEEHPELRSEYFWWLQGRYHLMATFVALFSLIASFSLLKTTHAFRFYSMFVVGFFVALPEIEQFLSAHSYGRLVVAVLGFGLGGTFFSTHIPERYFPRTFDLILSSHTLWHCGYLIGLYQMHAVLAIKYTGRVPWEEAALAYLGLINV